MRSPAYASCSGEAILAHSDEAHIDLILKSSLTALTPQTIVQPDELRAELEDVRKKGAAYDRRGLFKNVVGVAAPVFDHDGKAVAAVSISGVAGRMSLSRFDAAARAAAAALSRALHSPR